MSVHTIYIFNFAVGFHTDTLGSDLTGFHSNKNTKKVYVEILFNIISKIKAVTCNSYAKTVGENFS